QLCPDRQDHPRRRSLAQEAAHGDAVVGLQVWNTNVRSDSHAVVVNPKCPGLRIPRPDVTSEREGYALASQARVLLHQIGSQLDGKPGPVGLVERIESELLALAPEVVVLAGFGLEVSAHNRLGTDGARGIRRDEWRQWWHRDTSRRGVRPVDSAKRSIAHQG